ncbi:MAG: VTT domain-containing protein [bacterium]|nr:VTT domain-containing protein [bacterium]
MVSILSAPFRWTRQLYDWVLKWGSSKNAALALFLLAVAEASFFPIPPDALLIALCMGAYRKWSRFAIICSAGSILGGVLGYLIGLLAFDLIGDKMLGLTAALSGVEQADLLQTAQYWFNEKTVAGMSVGPWAVGIAGFTPIPYKVFTIAAGFFKMSFTPFLIASIISRSLRFFVVAGLIGLLYKKFGDRIQTFIDRYFNWLAVAFVVLLVLGFVSIKYFNG